MKINRIQKGLLVLWVTGSSWTLQGPRFQNRSAPSTATPTWQGLVLSSWKRARGRLELSSWPEKGQAWQWPRLHRAERIHVFRRSLQDLWFGKTKVMLRSSGGRQAERIFHRAHALTTAAAVPEAYLLWLLMAHWVT